MLILCKYKTDFTVRLSAIWDRLLTQIRSDELSFADIHQRKVVNIFITISNYRNRLK